MEDILYLDIETAPNVSYTWGMWEQNVIKFEKQWYILSFSAKWHNGEHITKGLDDYHKRDDQALTRELWRLMNRAKIIICHNGDKFDLKKVSTRMIYWGLGPPSPYKTIDTLKIARRYFSFNSNRLDDLGEYLKLGRKIKHQGFELWEGCMRGDKESWKLMKEYNAQDVVLLEKVYHRLMPWIRNHPNLDIYSERTICPKCQSPEVVREGFHYTNLGKYQQISCKKCRGWSYVGANLLEKKPLKNL